MAKKVLNRFKKFIIGFCEAREREALLRLSPYIQDRADLHHYLKKKGLGGL